MNVAYVRVSTVDQNESRQVEALEKFKIEKWFKEKVSAKDTKRPELQAMLDFVREDDTIYIHDFSRLARSTKDLLDILDLLETKGVNLVSNKENLDTSTPTGKLLVTMIAAINEFERQNLLERQKEGIAIAKREGKFKGGQAKKINDDIFNRYYADYKSRKINKVQFAAALDISRPTLDKLLKEKGEKMQDKDMFGLFDNETDMLWGIFDTREEAENLYNEQKNKQHYRIEKVKASDYIDLVTGNVIEQHYRKL